MGLALSFFNLWHGQRGTFKSVATLRLSPHFDQYLCSRRLFFQRNSSVRLSMALLFKRLNAIPTNIFYWILSCILFLCIDYSRYNNRSACGLSNARTSVIEATILRLPSPWIRNRRCHASEGFDLIRFDTIFWSQFDALYFGLLGWHD